VLLTCATSVRHANDTADGFQGRLIGMDHQHWDEGVLDIVLNDGLGRLRRERAQKTLPVSLFTDTAEPGPGQVDIPMQTANDDDADTGDAEAEGAQVLVEMDRTASWHPALELSPPPPPPPPPPPTPPPRAAEQEPTSLTSLKSIA
jgi:hypothetical protein